MAQLVSDSGAEPRQQTANARKAVLDREIAAAITMQATDRIAGVPKSVPRGHPPEWYLERAEKAEQVSATAEEPVHLLADMEHRNQMEGLTPEKAWAGLVGGHRWPGDHGLLGTLDCWIDHIGARLPYMMAKRSTEQRQWCQHVIRAKMEDLIAAFDGGGPWPR
jgi:hypothetical protein